LDSKQKELEVLQKLEATAKKEFPIIFVHQVPVGNVADLEDWMINTKIDALLESEERSQAQMVSIDDRLENMKEHKMLLENQIQKAQKQNKTDIVAELQSSISQLDRLSSISTLIKARDAKNGINSTSSVSVSEQPLRSDTPPIEYLSENKAISAFSQTKDVAVNLVDKAVETGMWCMSGVGSALSSAASYFTWGNPAKIPHDPKLEYKSDNLEFEVIQTNWYWRQQRRLLRFLMDQFARINPLTHEIRSVHRYKDIDRVIITGKTILTIKFNDGSQPEYYQSVDIENIVEVLLVKSKPYANFPVTYQAASFM